MNFKDLLSDALPVISKFAPSIAGAIGGPVGVAAGYVVPLLANAFGVHPSDTAGLAQKILHDSESQGKLEQLEIEHGDQVCGLMNSIDNLASLKLNIELTWK